MPAQSERQRKAMGAEIGWRKKHPGKKRRFKSMTIKQLKEFTRK